MSKKKEEEKYKRYIEYRRKDLPPDPEGTEVIYSRIDHKQSSMNVADAPDPPFNQVRAICGAFVKDEINMEEFRERLAKLRLFPSPPTKQWLKKVITAYFYGKAFKKLLEAIREL